MPSNEYFGWLPTPPRQVKVIAEMRENRHREALDLKDAKLYGVMSMALPDQALPFMSTLKFDPKLYESEAQLTGDCTSHALRGAATESNCVEIDIKGEQEEYVKRMACEPFYIQRGHAGQGMNPGLAIEVACKNGIIYRDKYRDIDLSEYNQKTVDWTYSINKTSLYDPLPADMKEVGKDHLALYYARIKTIDELRTAIANGYGVIHGSNIGVSNVRDSNGISSWSKNWSHCMQIGGYAIIKDILCLLFINSWGKWNSGGMPKGIQMPAGSFFLVENDLRKSWKQGAETWAIGDINGFKARKLPNYGTGEFI